MEYVPKKRLIAGDIPHEVRAILHEASVATVCESALCPNLNECYSRKTATFLILGDACTRACGFCSVRKSVLKPIDDQEPFKVAAAAKELGLEYIVVTSVTRDDLQDGGAGQFAKVIEAIKGLLPVSRIEVLTPDFAGKCGSVESVLSAGPDVFGHNIETVRRLYRSARKGADYDRSIGIIEQVKRAVPLQVTKSSIMLGLGETDGEVIETIAELKEAGCDILTIGQYLRPREGNLPVVRFLRPEEFEHYRKVGEDMGFGAVLSGAFVRSSYRAEEMFNSINSKFEYRNPKQIRNSKFENSKRAGLEHSDL